MQIFFEYELISLGENCSLCYVETLSLTARRSLKKLVAVHNMMNSFQSNVAAVSISSTGKDPRSACSPVLPSEWLPCWLPPTKFEPDWWETFIPPPKPRLRHILQDMPRRGLHRNAHLPLQLLWFGGFSEQIVFNLLFFCQVGVVHRSCLEKWLSSSQYDTCELCRYTESTSKWINETPGNHWLWHERTDQYYNGFVKERVLETTSGTWCEIILLWRCSETAF